MIFQSGIDKFCDSASILNIEDLTSFLCSVIYTNIEYIHKAVKKLIPIYAAYFEKDMLRAIYLFNFEFMRCVCGLDLLSRYQATSIEKKSARLIVSVIPEKEFAEVIVKC